MNPITEIKIWLKLKPVLEREQKLMRMRLSTSVVCQLLTGVVDIITIITPALNTQQKEYAGMALAVVHVVINVIAHLSTTDGQDTKTALQNASNSVSKPQEGHIEESK